MTGNPHVSALAQRILRAGLAVSVAHVLFKAAGLLQAMVMARFVPPGEYDVVYAFAFEGCLFSLFLVGEEALGPSFMPVFMRQLDTQGERSAWRFANTVLTLQCLLLAAVVVVVMSFPAAVVRLFTSWDAANEPAKFAHACSTLRAMAPCLIGLSIGSTTYVILNGYKRFFLAAFGDAAWKLCVMGFVLVGMGALRVDARAVVAGVVAGSVLKVAVHFVGMRDKVRFVRPALSLSHPGLREMGALMLPLLVGIVFAKVRDVFNNVTVLSHLHTDGLLTANSFGRKLYVTVGFLVPYALSIAMFPFFCELVDRRDHARLAALVTRSGHMLLALFIPLAAACAALAAPVCSLLLGGGRMPDGVVGWSAVSMACYSLVLPAQAVEFLLMQAFFANRRMVAVMAMGIGFSALSVGVSAVGIHWLGATGVWALAVVAAGFTVSRTLKTAAMAALLKRRVGCFPARETAPLLVKALACGAATAGLGLAAMRGWTVIAGAGGGRWAEAGMLAAGAAGCAVGFAVSTRVLRLHQPREMLAWVAARGRGGLRRNFGMAGE